MSHFLCAEFLLSHNLNVFLNAFCAQFAVNVTSLI